MLSYLLACVLWRGKGKSTPAIDYHLMHVLPLLSGAELGWHAPGCCLDLHKAFSEYLVFGKTEPLLGFLPLNKCPFMQREGDAGAELGAGELKMRLNLKKWLQMKAAQRTAQPFLPPSASRAPNMARAITSSVAVNG